MSFSIFGPYNLKVGYLEDKASSLKIPYVKKKESKAIVKREVGDIGAGLYIFVIRRRGEAAGKPWYVGITRKKNKGALYRESLHNDKLKKYAVALTKAESGRPYLFFLTPEGRTDNIGELEQFLIWLGRQRNPQLLNEHKVRLSPKSLHAHLQSHQISGVLNASPGNPGKKAKAFRAMIGWEAYMHVQVWTSG